MKLLPNEPPSEERLGEGHRERPVPCQSCGTVKTYHQTGVCGRCRLAR